MGAVGDDVGLDIAILHSSTAAAHSYQTRTVLAATHRSLDRQPVNLSTEITEKGRAFMLGVVDINGDGMIVAIDVETSRVVRRANRTRSFKVGSEQDIVAMFGHPRRYLFVVRIDDEVVPVIDRSDFMLPVSFPILSEIFMHPLSV